MADFIISIKTIKHTSSIEYYVKLGLIMRLTTEVIPKKSLNAPAR